MIRICAAAATTVVMPFRISPFCLLAQEKKEVVVVVLVLVFDLISSLPYNNVMWVGGMAHGTCRFLRRSRSVENDNIKLKRTCTLNFFSTKTKNRNTNVIYPLNELAATAYFNQLEHQTYVRRCLCLMATTSISHDDNQIFLFDRSGLDR